MITHPSTSPIHPVSVDTHSHLPQPQAGRFPHRLSLPASPEHQAARARPAPHLHRSVPAQGSPACPSPEGGHCSSPWCTPHSLQSRCQGLTQPRALRTPFRRLHSNPWGCRCPQGPSPTRADRDKQSCALHGGTCRRSKEQGTSVGTSVPAPDPAPGPGTHLQDPTLGVLRKDCRSCWLAWLALPCLSSPGWAVLFNSLQGQHSTKEGLWRACSSAGQRHDWLWRVKIERGHGRAAAASLTNALYSLHNVRPGTCAVPAPPGISIDWFPRTHLQKFPCTLDLGEGWLEISRAGQCQFFIQSVIFFV